MRTTTREVTHNNRKELLVYITPQEQNNSEIQQQIDSYKKQYKNVILFVSGNADIKAILKQLDESLLRPQKVS